MSMTPMLKKFKTGFNRLFGSKNDSQLEFKCRNVKVKGYEYLFVRAVVPDIPEILDIERAVYKGQTPWNFENFEAQIREQLDAEYKHWDDLKKNGCSDPAWPDGVNLNLVRNHIIYWYRLLRERTNQTVQLSMFDAGMDLRNERPLPPEVPDRYMVPTGKYPDRLNGKWDGLIFDPTI